MLDGRLAPFTLGKVEINKRDLGTWERVCFVHVISIALLKRGRIALQGMYT